MARGFTGVVGSKPIGGMAVCVPLSSHWQSFRLQNVNKSLLLNNIATAAWKLQNNFRLSTIYIVTHFILLHILLKIIWQCPQKEASRPLRLGVKWKNIIDCGWSSPVNTYKVELASDKGVDTHNQQIKTISLKLQVAHDMCCLEQTIWPLMYLKIF